MVDIDPKALWFVLVRIETIDVFRYSKILAVIRVQFNSVQGKINWQHVYFTAAKHICLCNEIMKFEIIGECASFSNNLDHRKY